MAALLKDRNTRNKHLGRVQRFPVLAATQIYKGAAVAIDAAGFAIPATNVAGQIVVGVATHSVLGGAANGDEYVNCERGVFEFNGLGGDLPTQALVGRPVYVGSDNEVGATAGAGVIMGTLEEIEGSKYWVNIFDQA